MARIKESQKPKKLHKAYVSPSEELASELAAGMFKYPKSLWRLNFKSDKMEEDFRLAYDHRSTPVFRTFSLIFMLFHIVSLFARDVWEYDRDTVRDILFISRLPCICVAFATAAFTYFKTWETFQYKQRFFAVTLMVQGILLLFISFTTLKGSLADDEIALPNAVIACAIVGYTSFRLRTKWATISGWTLQAIANILFALAVYHEWSSLTWNAMSFNVPFTAFNVIGMLTCYQIEKAERVNFFNLRVHLKQTALGMYEGARAEFFLFNILPYDIVQRLKLQPTIAKRVPNVTVMFVCMEAVIDATMEMDERVSVRLLNLLFGVCDTYASKCGVEKVKTINDKYMCVAGAPDETDDHARRMADCALSIFRRFSEMERDGKLKQFADKGVQFKVRAGISSGPIVHGVIGLNKFCWDIWGDTVNTASRMEYPKGGKKLSGQIRISESTAREIKDTHEYSFNGELEVKGKGPLNTYILTGRKDGVHTVWEDDRKREDEELERIAMKNAKASEAAANNGGDVSDGSRPDPKRDRRTLSAARSFVEMTPKNRGGRHARAGSVGIKRRRKSVNMEPPRLDMASYVKESASDFKEPRWADVDHRERDEFRFSRFQNHYHEQPTLPISMIIAIGVYAAIGVMDYYLQYSITRRVYAVRYGIVLSLLLLHWVFAQSAFYRPAKPASLVSRSGAALGDEEKPGLDRAASHESGGKGTPRLAAMTSPSSRGLRPVLEDASSMQSLPDLLLADQAPQPYKVTLASTLALLSVVVMVAAGSYIQREVEKDPVPGAEFYAPLRVAFAIYMTFSIFALSTRWVFATIMCSLLYLGVEWAIGYPITDEQVYFILWAVGLVVFGFYIAWQLEMLAFYQWFYTRSVVRDKRIVARKKLEADELLANIVPLDIIPKLDTFTDMSSLARHCEKASILFSDVAGFTALSEKIGEPKALVNWLNTFFTVFDKIADSYNIQKIKTIGDAYVACGGLHESDDISHVNQMVNMALSVQDELARRKDKFQDKIPVSLRIGVHVGPVLAGVIGQRKFQFDIFGKSVILAEEMESSGAVGRVHISDACKKSLIRGHLLYEFEEGAGYEDESTGESFPTWFVTASKKKSTKSDKIRQRLGSAIDTSTKMKESLFT